MRDDSIHDAPNEWRPYGAMLSSMAPTPLDPARRRIMRERISKLGTGGDKRLRWYTGGGFLGVTLFLAVALAFIVPTSQLGRARFDSAISSPVPTASRHKSPSRTNHRRLPVIPHSSLPTVIDTAIPGNPGGYRGHHPTVSPVPPAATGR